jgi:hypothetical protein
LHTFAWKWNAAMGSQRPKPRVYAPQSGLEPHFHITNVEYEASSDGTITVSAYEERKGELILRYTCTITATNLIRSARAASVMAADAHNISEWAKFHSEGSGGNGH